MNRDPENPGFESSPVGTASGSGQRKSRFHRAVRISVPALALLILAGWLLPSFFSAERYRRRLESGLERALQRRVTFGALSYRLLPRPGFSIENAVVHEDPAFGYEPFARVERIDCELRWRSLLHSRLDIARLYLERPNFNFVRNATGSWNVESFLRRTGLAAPTGSTGTATALPGGLAVEADDARIDFKVGANKKPFALTELRASVYLNRQGGQVPFRLAAKPLRTDRSLATPGVVRLDGVWTPGADLDGPLDATLQTREALLYDWIPLVTGRNPQIYGMLDAQIHLTGSLHQLRFDGQTRLTQLQRWEQRPPADPMPSTVLFRSQFDRARGRVVIESLEATFIDSRVHLTGSIDHLPSSPEMDLVLAVERSRLEDFQALTGRLLSHPPSFGLSGRVDALLSIQGPWRDRHYHGFVGAREVRLRTPSGSFPVSEIDLQVAENGVRLAPVRVALAPRVELVADGSIAAAPAAVPARRHSKRAATKTAGGPLRYELSLTAKAAPLHDLIGFGRAIGLFAAPGVDARGSASVSVNLSGPAWPLGRPAVQGLAELHATRLLVPGFTEPIHLPRAHVEVDGNRVTADPVLAVLGTSVFNARLEHQGGRAQPWEFDIRANKLSVEQGSFWFEALGRRQPVPLLERLPGLGSFREVRAAASGLFGGLKAHGHFSSPLVIYRSLNLTDFKTSADISGRIIRLRDAVFRAGGGRGEGRLVVDLTSAPASVAVDVSMADGNLHSLAAYLPAVLGKVRGNYSVAGHFEMRGLSHEEIAGSLQGRATARLSNVFLGEFDPLQAVAREAGWGTLVPARGDGSVKSLVTTLQVHDRRVWLGNLPLAVSGAQLKVSGVCGFDGGLELDVHADLRHVTRRWLNEDEEADTRHRLIDFRLAGPLDKLAVEPEIAASRVGP